MSEKAAKKKAPAKKTSAKAPKVKKAKPKKEMQPATEATKVVQEKPSLGPSPAPMVESRHGHSMDERVARGYSFGELRSAGLESLEARRHHVQIDIRRRTVLEENVQRLKGWYKAPEPKAKPAATEKAPAKTPAKRSKK